MLRTHTLINGGDADQKNPTTLSLHKRFRGLFSEGLSRIKEVDNSRIKRNAPTGIFLDLFYVHKAVLHRSLFLRCHATFLPLWSRRAALGKTSFRPGRVPGIMGKISMCRMRQTPLQKNETLKFVLGFLLMNT